MLLLKLLKAKRGIGTKLQKVILKYILNESLHKKYLIRRYLISGFCIHRHLQSCDTDYADKKHIPADRSR